MSNLNHEMNDTDKVLNCKGRGCTKHDTYPAHMPITHHPWWRRDAYGISTGPYCNECYENNYPYRKDEYDPHNEMGTR